MKDEIKEILDNTLEYLEGIDETRNTKILTTNETYILLDYITNLQEENQTLKNQLDFIEEQNHIIDKLKKENEIIKSQLNVCSQDLYMENLKLKLENKTLKALKEGK